MLLHACSCNIFIDQARRVILGAMKEWERSVPCIKWQSKSDSDIDFVHFYKGQG